MKALGENKTNKLNKLFLAILRPFQDFSRKLPKLFEIRNACIVYLVNFGTKCSTFLKYFYWQKNNYLIAILMSTVHLPTLISNYLVLLLEFCKA